MPLRKKAQIIKKNLTMTPPLPNNLRTREATNAKWSAKKRVVETTKLSAPRTRRRRLVKGPSQRK